MAKPVLVNTGATLSVERQELLYREAMGNDAAERQRLLRDEELEQERLRREARRAKR